MNPCPPKSKVIPGVNNYFSHLFPNKYIHCDFDGRAFVRNCALGTRWNQEKYACSSSDTDISEVTQATLIQQSDNNYAQQNVQPIQTIKPVVPEPIFNRPIQSTIVQPTSYGTNQVVQPVQIVNTQPTDFSSSETIIKPIQQQTDSYGSSQTFIQPTEQQTFVEPSQQVDNYGSNQIDQPDQFLNTQTNNYGSSEEVQPIQASVVQSNNYNSNQNFNPAIQQTNNFLPGPTMIQPVKPTVIQSNNLGPNQIFKPKLLKSSQNSNAFQTGQALQPSMFPQQNNFALNQAPPFQSTFTASGGQVFKPLSAKLFSNPFVPANVFNWYSTQEY